MPRAMPKDNVNSTIKQFIEMEAMDCSTEEKMKEIFGITSKDDPGYHAAECKMSRWRKHPMYDQVWREAIAKLDYIDYSKSRTVLRKAMKNFDKDPWLAMNAAINALGTTGKKIYGNEETSVNVRIEGLPDIGSPDQEDG